MNPIIDTIIIGAFILFLVFLASGYHRSKDYENDDTYERKDKTEEKND